MDEEDERRLAAFESDLRELEGSLASQDGNAMVIALEQTYCSKEPEKYARRAFQCARRMFSRSCHTDGGVEENIKYLMRAGERWLRVQSERIAEDTGVEKNRDWARAALYWIWGWLAQIETREGAAEDKSEIAQARHTAIDATCAAINELRTSECGPLEGAMRDTVAATIAGWSGKANARHLQRMHRAKRMRRTKGPCCCGS